MSADGQGIDKGLQPFRGRPMALHAIERLAPQVRTLLINANRNLERYREFGWPVVSDAIEGFAGPLAGLHAGMRVARTRYVVTVPCDSPFLPSDLVARLSAALASTPGARLAVARTGAQRAPGVRAGSNARCSKTSRPSWPAAGAGSTPGRPRWAWSRSTSATKRHSATSTRRRNSGNRNSNESAADHRRSDQLPVRLRPARPAGCTGPRDHRSRDRAGGGDRARRDPQCARARACRGRGVADRRAFERQLGDGRIRGARCRSRQRPGDCAAARRHRAGGAAVCRRGRRRRRGARHHRRRDAGGFRHRRDAGDRRPRRRSSRRAGRPAAGPAPPAARRGPRSRPGRAARRQAARAGRPRPAGVARLRRGARCAAGCAWRSSPPATSCARSASRSAPARSTTATATRSSAC